MLNQKAVEICTDKETKGEQADSFESFGEQSRCFKVEITLVDYFFANASCLRNRFEGEMLKVTIFGKEYDCPDSQVIEVNIKQ